jgi:hypothetical protein
MRTVTLTDQSTAKDIVKDVMDEELLIMRDGHAVALLVPFDDDDAEWYVRERDPTFLQSIVRAREQIATGKAISHEELKRELGAE